VECLSTAIRRFSGRARMGAAVLCGATARILGARAEGVEEPRPLQDPSRHSSSRRQSDRRQPGQRPMTWSGPGQLFTTGTSSIELGVKPTRSLSPSIPSRCPSVGSMGFGRTTVRTNHLRPPRRKRERPPEYDQSSFPHLLWSRTPKRSPCPVARNMRPETLAAPDVCLTHR